MASLTPRRPGPSRRRGALAPDLTILRADPLTRAGAGALAAIAAIYLLPVVDRETLREWSGGLFLAVLASWTATAAWLRRGRANAPGDRRYWSFIGAAFACWATAIALSMLPFWATRPPLVTLIYDFLCAAFSLLLILATTDLPHREAGWLRAPGTRRLVYTGAVVFGLAMAVYFDVLPYVLHREEFDGRMPSYFLYLSLDFALLLRAVALYRTAPEPAWRTQYGAFLATALFNGFGDLLDALNRSGVFAYESRAWDFVWYAIFPPLALAARLPPSRWSPSSRFRMRTAELRTPLLTFALLVPIVHFTLTAWIYHGDPLERPRRLVAFVAMLFLLALARLQEALLERYSVQLERGVERARERLADAERLEAVGRLAGGVAHEFNNKLAVILGCQEELALATRGKPELAESLDAIRRAAEHATSLTSKLLAVGRRRMVRPEPIDIDDALEELTPPLRHALGTGIALEVRALPRPALARVDRGGLESALLNLAANAAEATGGSGRVTLSPSVIDLGLEEIPPLSAVAPGRFVRIEMGDDGPGASEEVVARLFEPFFTTHPFGSGRGLGLASVRGIVEQCGGFVTVDTSPGNGFRCRMHFPVASPSSSPSRALSLNPEA